MFVQKIRMDNIRKLYEKLLKGLETVGITIEDLDVPHFGHSIRNYESDIRKIGNNAEYRKVCETSPDTMRELVECVHKIIGLIGEEKRGEGKGIDIPY